MCRAESLPQFPLNCRMDGLRTTGLLELFVLSCLKDLAEKKGISCHCIAVVLHDQENLIMRSGDKFPRDVWILVEGP